MNISMQQFNLHRYFSTTSKCLNKFINNHYKVLGIEQNASQAEIKKAFYQLSKKYHPDALSSGDKRKFIQICEAYETLRNEQKRRIYDKMSENRNETTSNYEYAQNHAKNHHNSWEHQEFYQTRKNQPENVDDWKDFNEKINYDEEEKKFRRIYEEEKKFRKIYEEEKKFRKIYEEEKKFRKIYEEEKKFRRIASIGMLIAFALSWLGLFIEQRWLTILAFISIIALLLCQIGFFKMNLAKLIEFLVLLALMGFMLYPNDIKVD